MTIGQVNNTIKPKYGSSVIDLKEQKDGVWKMEQSKEAPKVPVKTAALLAASLLALAAINKNDIKPSTNSRETYISIHPKDLSYESDDPFEKDYFKKYVEGYEAMKSYGRVDKNTLRFVNELDEVVEHSLDNHVHDVRVLGMTIDGNLYPDKNKPLSMQKYYDDETYDKLMAQKADKEKEAKIKKYIDIYKYSVTAGMTALSLILALQLSKAVKKES